MQSSLINRYVFDPELRRRNEQSGVEYLQAAATSFESTDGGVSIGTKSKVGNQVVADRIDAKWVVDCSGRNRFLSRKLGLKARYTSPQRSCFWFRLVDFEPELLGQLMAIKEPQSSFDSYYTMHHFMGRNNWAWCIPMRPHDGHATLISLGVVWRPDVADLSIKSVESFTEYYRSEHPVLADMVGSGTVLDQGLYRNYMYESTKVYSPKGWFIVGDAADTVDPLYSTGLVLSTLQITQVESMISDDRQGKLTQSQTEDLESVYKQTREMMQNEISELYEVTQDAWQCHWRMYISSLIYFHLMLPAWLAGYMVDAKGARWMTRFLGVAKSNTASLRRIIELSAKNPRNGSPKGFANKYHETINWRLSRGDESDLPKHLSTMLLRLAKYRFLFWRRSGFKDFRQQSSGLLSEVAVGILFGTVLRRVKLRNLAPRKTVAKDGIHQAMGKESFSRPHVFEQDHSLVTANQTR